MKINSRLLIVVAVVSIFFSAAASAQVGIYAGFSGAQLNPGSSTLYGPLFGAYWQKGYILNLGADLRGSFLTHNGTTFNTGAIGPRVAIKPPVFPLRPYGEALVGIASLSGGGSSSHHLNYQLIAGIDTTILPRIDWRIVEFDYSAVTSNSVNAKIFTTGLVLRLP
ncbi:hypothetical protein [Edaphobacter sp.]|uniref:hypothetical protein n=1 Tax=Edaphobacter sp. TaxID=1934404 RepID=UPI002DB9E8EA|nr:hypothetical protein [Edaphobacter sp.]HEU5342558.1 hypothetical protein [Edaphobacter sp.]